MARRRRRERDDDYDDDRRDRRPRYSGGGGGSGTTIMIIGAVVCIGLLAGTYVLVTQTGKSQREADRRRGQASRRTQSQRQAVTDVSTGAASGGVTSSGGTPSAAGRAPRVADIRCVGQWVMRTPDREKGLPDPRHLEAACPSCGGKVSYKAGACSCGQKLDWPSSVKCDFCGGEGNCKICEDDGLCPWCKKHPPRQMMGMVLDKCPMNCPSGKCAACKGSKRCDKCEGNGRIELNEGLFR